MAMVPAMTMFDFEKVKVNGIITPKDGTIRNNLNVDVSLGNNILETTTTDSDGEYDLEFFIPSGSYFYVPMIRCGNNKKAIFDVIQDSSSQIVLQVVETNLNITSTKDILSFQGNDTATIDATLTYGTIPQPIEGEEILFVVKDSQDNIIDTQVRTTLPNGVASIVYESQGIGDVTISASVGGFVSKTYSIVDASYYNPNDVSTNLTISDLNLPTNFKATYTLKRQTNKHGWIEIGQNSSNNIFFGVDSGSGNIAIYIRVNGTYETYQRSGNNIVLANTDTVIEYVNNNGSQSITANGTTINLSNNSITSRNYLKYDTDSGIIKELLIKPL